MIFIFVLKINNNLCLKTKQKSCAHVQTHITFKNNCKKNNNNNNNHEKTIVYIKQYYTKKKNHIKK